MPNHVAEMRKLRIKQPSKMKGGRYAQTPDSYSSNNSASYGKDSPVADINAKIKQLSIDQVPRESTQEHHGISKDRTTAGNPPSEIQIYLGGDLTKPNNGGSGGSENKYYSEYTITERSNMQPIKVEYHKIAGNQDAKRPRLEVIASQTQQGFGTDPVKIQQQKFSTSANDGDLKMLTSESPVCVATSLDTTNTKETSRQREICWNQGKRDSYLASDEPIAEEAKVKSAVSHTEKTFQPLKRKHPGEKVVESESATPNGYHHEAGQEVFTIDLNNWLWFKEKIGSLVEKKQPGEAIAEAFQELERSTARSTRYFAKPLPSQNVSSVEKLSPPKDTFICQHPTNGLVVVGESLEELETFVAALQGSRQRPKRKRIMVKPLGNPKQPTSQPPRAQEANYHGRPAEKSDQLGASFKKSGIKIHVFVGDITKLVVGAVVNASNIDLRHGGGVAGAIAKAAGPHLQAECTKHIKQTGKLLTSDAYTSQAHNMFCEWIIHVAGPRWSEYNDKEKAGWLLRDSFTKCLAEADIHGVRSVAIPAVGSGIFGSPLQLVAQSMFETTMRFVENNHNSTSVRDILFVDISVEVIQLLLEKCQLAIYDEHLWYTEPCYHEFVSDIHEDNGQQSGTHSSFGQANQFPDINEKGDTLQNHLQTKVYTGLATGEASSSSTTLQKVPHNEVVCSICLDNVTSPEILSCNHVFCKPCIDTWFKNKPTCPSCGMIHGEMSGDQPEGGQMIVNHLQTTLPGFTDVGTIEINYHIPEGFQTKSHPNPGQRYKGINRKAFLPNNVEGNNVLHLLRRAFDAKLTFTIGRSTTTGREGQITWNDIHHKTSMTGGPTRFGYPDDTYLSRVKEELAAKGIK